MSVFDQGHALIVGVGADLPNTIADAAGLADILKDPARCAYPSDHVHLLTAEDARRDQILAALDALAQSTTALSTVVVYFSGHGYRTTSPTGEFYYLMPFGFDLNRLFQTAISGAEFTARLRAIPAQKLLVLLDCCHAGGVGEAKAPGLQMAKSPIPPEAGDLLAEGSGRVLIASSQEDELSFGGQPYSAFTLALIESLCGAGVAKQDGYVRVADLALHARQVVPGRTEERQHPILHFEQADNFVLAYYASGEAQPKGLPFTVRPRIEPEPGAWRGFDQREQTVSGPQTNVAGDLYGGINQQFGDRVVISGDISGQVAVGDGITQYQTLGATPPAPTGGELAALRQALADLRLQVAAQVPPDRQGAALERVTELAEAVTAGEPDLATMEYVQRWFARQLPGLAGAVTGIVLHPTVGKLVAGAGAALAAEYRRRFGSQ
jgi:hypothetical protein